MAGDFTDKGRERALLAGLGDAVSAASAQYLMLLTALPANPDDASLADYAANELTDTGYSRQVVTWTLSTATGDPVVSNSADVDFGPFDTDVPQVTHVALCDVASGTTGNVLAWWQLDQAVDAGAGDIIRLAAGDLVMQ